jgi:hypothetical protein
MRTAATTAVLALATLSATSAGLAQKPPSLFRLAFNCPERGPPTSVCIAGTLTPGATVTLVTKDRAMPASVKEVFKDTTLWDNVNTFTRVEGGEALPKGAGVIAVILPSDSIKVVPQVEIQDAAIAERLKRQVADDLQDYTTWCVDLGDKCSLRTRLIRLSPAIVIAEVNYSSDREIFFQKALLVGKKIVDLHKRSLGEREIDRVCARLSLAFSVSGHLHAATSQYACEGDTSEGFVQDLSGPTPRVVAHW